MRKGERKTVEFREWAEVKTLRSLVSDDHLSDEDLDAAVDEGVQHPHVATCAMCRAEVEDLRLWSAEAAPPLSNSRDGKAEALPPHSRMWLIAASAAFGVVALSVIALLLRKPDAVPVTASNPPAPVAPVNAAPPPPVVVASLIDGAGRIELLEDGTIAGIEPRSSRDVDDARAVLSGGAIATPTFIAAMPGAVRGGAGSTHSLRAIEPFRSAVREPRPRFSWTPVRDARGYRVAVFDADYEEVARSEVLHRTNWTPPQALPAGGDLSWHVVAETDAGEISSSGSDFAEAVFRVLPPNEAAEVSAGEAHYASSHLLRGLLYTRHGLLHDAEREFRSLAKQNPGSPVVRALIDSVSR